MRTGTVICLAGCIALTAPPRAFAAQGIFDEAKIGILDHDIPIGADHDEPGADFNGELLFLSPGLLAPVFAPRPHIGVTVNSAGKTSYAYAGLTWLAPVTEALFADLGLGGAVHSGPNESTARDHKGLGTRLLFHESVEIGYRVTPVASVAVYIDHVSNADIGKHNPGITNVGLRLGWSL
ncbi:MAG TPA: acyloxyacyl hydrolase [Stellaceae bacterium]|nr:acyloxyacyl hydrolase [Stellaceae bacterium]